MSETDLWFGTLSATVRVEDLPASRQVVAIERQANGDWRVCGQAVSNAEGIATLPITGLPTSRIYAIAIDEWGKPFAPGMTVAYGDVIRPTQFLGWMYQVTAPGVLPTTEPEWWNGMAGVPQPVGTAMMQAVRHYQPIAHGPVGDIEWVEQEFDPHWDKVVSLLHFDGDLTDETGRVWGVIGNPSFEHVEPIYGTGSFKTNGNDAAQTANHELINNNNDPYCIEFTFKVVSLDNFGALNPLFWCYSYSSWGDSHIGINSLSGLRVQFHSGSNSWFIAEGLAPITIGVKYHLALTYDGSDLRIFLDGVLVYTGVGVKIQTPTTPLRFGTVAVGSYMQGSNHIYDELRITKGVARYTENFDPPTAPFPNVGPPL